MNYIILNGELYHHGILGQKWGVRRYQNKDGSLTEAGKRRYMSEDGSLTSAGKRKLKSQIATAEKQSDIHLKKYHSSRPSEFVAKSPMVQLLQQSKKLTDAMNEYNLAEEEYDKEYRQLTKEMDELFDKKGKKFREEIMPDRMKNLGYSQAEIQEYLRNLKRNPFFYPEYGDTQQAWYYENPDIRKPYEDRYDELKAREREAFKKYDTTFREVVGDIPYSLIEQALEILKK